MSEHTFAHARTGTFPVTVTGSVAPHTAEARWVRDHHVVHLFLPEIAGTAEGSITLSALPQQIRPSRAEVFPVPVRLGDRSQLGALAWDAGAPSVQAHASIAREAFNGPFTLGPCAVHYLSIPGQMEDAAGVMQRVPEGETLPEPEPRPEPEPEPEPPYRGTGQAEPAPAAEGEPTYA